MRVRIRFGKGARVGTGNRNHQRVSNQRLAHAVGALLTPAAVMALALGMWRAAADLKWTSSFAIATGLFSHWQVWLGGAAVLQVGARLLHRYGSRDEGLPSHRDATDTASPPARTQMM